MFTSIRGQIVLLVALPILVATWFIGQSIFNKLEVVQRMERQEPVSQLSAHLGVLIHEIQKERGATSVYLGSDAKLFRDRLVSQRELTDQKRNQLLQFLESFDSSVYKNSIQIALSDAVTQVASIDYWRTQVDTRAISASEALQTYTNCNATLLGVVREGAEIRTDAEISKQIASYVNFMCGKERAGIERAILAQAFSNDTFDEGASKKFLHLVAEQDVFFDVFQSLATPDQLSFYERQMCDPIMHKVRRLREIAINRGRNADKAPAVAKLFQVLGFGGAIHEFKNFIIHQDVEHKHRFSKYANKAIESLNVIEAMPSISNEDRQQIEIVRDTVLQYQARADQASAMFAAGKTAAEVDKSVNLDEQHTIDALYALRDSLSTGNFGISPSHWFDTATR